MAVNYTATRSNVAASTSTATLLPANQRSAALVYNDSSATLYLGLGVGTTTTDYTVQVPAGGYWECPGSGGEVFDGAITGVWASATGTARCTEVI